MRWATSRKRRPAWYRHWRSIAVCSPPASTCDGLHACCGASDQPAAEGRRLIEAMLRQPAPVFAACDPHGDWRELLRSRRTLVVRLDAHSYSQRLALWERELGRAGIDLPDADRAPARRPVGAVARTDRGHGRHRARSRVVCGRAADRYRHGDRGRPAADRSHDRQARAESRFAARLGRSRPAAGDAHPRPRARRRHPQPARRLPGVGVRAPDQPSAPD